MKTMLNIKTEATLKKAAQKIAKEIGVPLSTIVNVQLKQFIAERQLILRAPEIPNAKTAREIDRALADFRRGKKGAFSSGFTNVEDAIAWLHKKA